MSLARILWTVRAAARLLAVLAPVTALSVLATAPAAAQITEYSVTAGSQPRSIAPGAGGMWFTERQGNRIGRIAPDGTLTEFSSGISPDAYPHDIAAGPGGMWFTEWQGNRIGRIAPDGTVTEFSAGISANSGPSGITAGPDGNLWFTESNTGKIGRITPSGEVTEFGGGPSASDITSGPDGNLWYTLSSGHIGRLVPGSGEVTQFESGPSGFRAPQDITRGPDGNLWYTDLSRNSVFKMTPSGVYTEFTAGISQYSQPYGITNGPDGNVWFTEYSGNRVARITPSGEVTEYTIPTQTAGPQGIAIGPGGSMWFTESDADKIGRLTIPSGGGGGADTTPPTVRHTGTDPEPINDGKGPLFRTRTPIFHGTAGTEAGDSSTLEVTIYEWDGAQWNVFQQFTTARRVDGSWSASPPAPLPDDTYEIEVIQRDTSHNVGRSGRYRFRIDATPPQVGVAVPAYDQLFSERRPLFQGTASMGEDDSRVVSVRIFQWDGANWNPYGGLIGAPVEPNGTWSTKPLDDLPDGTYDLEALLSDSAQNSATSGRIRFRIAGGSGGGDPGGGDPGGGSGPAGGGPSGGQQPTVPRVDQCGPDAARADTTTPRSTIDVIMGRLITGEAAVIHFEWGKSAALGNATGELGRTSPGSQFNTLPVWFSASPARLTGESSIHEGKRDGYHGLEWDTDYHYRMVATTIHTRQVLHGPICKFRGKRSVAVDDVGSSRGTAQVAVPVDKNGSTVSVQAYAFDPCAGEPWIVPLPGGGSYTDTLLYESCKAVGRASTAGRHPVNAAARGPLLGRTVVKRARKGTLKVKVRYTKAARKKAKRLYRKGMKFGTLRITVKPPGGPKRDATVAYRLKP